jgi:predicted nucleotidyltransferase
VTTDPPNLDGEAFDPTKVDADCLRRFCVEKGIRRIRVYGSATRGDFDPARSDIDLLIDFLPGRTPGFGFFALGDELAEILGRKVDVNTEKMLSEHFREEALHQAKVLYDAA